MNFTVEHLSPDVTLYLGDCLEVLPTLSGVDAVVTDPPYGIGIQYGEYQDSRENLAALIPSLVGFAKERCRRAIISCGPTQTHLYPAPDWMSVVCWNTTGSMGLCGFAQWMPLLVYGKDVGGGFRSRDGLVKSDVISISGGGGVGFMREAKPDHPCPKPLNVMDMIVTRYTDRAETILDPFMGSGTTGVAAVRLGRKFIGVEIDPKYYAIAKARIQQAIEEREMDMFKDHAPEASQPDLLEAVS